MKAGTQPRANKRMRHMPIAAVLLLFCICCVTVLHIAAAHNCMHDIIAKKAGPPSRGIVRELPRRGRSGIHLLTASESAWKPIRISVFKEDLTNTSKHCTRSGEERSDFMGETYICLESEILTEEKRKIIVDQVLPGAVKLHAERLLVQPITGRIVVPNRLYNPCYPFAVPSSHHTEGVENADMVIYVAAGPIRTMAHAWSRLCFYDPKTKRPIVGAINFGPQLYISLHALVRTGAHELGHALGFSYNVFLFLGMVSWRSDIRGKPNVVLVNTSKVVEKARAHYNCSTAPGVELEDAGELGVSGSHWERRNVKDDMMTPGTGVGYYSALTMAIFEDMGFYRANWSMAETMNWGRNTGCDFLEKKCVINGTTKYPDMFCTKKENVKLCTFDRLGLGICNTQIYDTPIPEWHHYFNDRSRGGSDLLADYCPFIEPYSNTWCTDGRGILMLGSRVGPTSRCLKGDNLYAQGKPVGDVCAEVQCNENNRTVSVKYRGNDAWHACPEGGHITPTGGFTSGKILCPKYSEVCFETGSDKSEVDLSPMKLRYVYNESNEEEHEIVFPGKRESEEEGDVVGWRIGQTTTADVNKGDTSHMEGTLSGSSKDKNSIKVNRNDTNNDKDAMSKFVSENSIKVNRNDTNNDKDAMSKFISENSIKVNRNDTNNDKDAMSKFVSENSIKVNRNDTNNDKDAMSKFISGILTNAGKNGANVGNRDASTAAGFFHMLLLLFLTALAFTTAY